MITGNYDFQLTACFNDAIEFTFIRYAGQPLHWVNGLINRGLIGQQMVSTNDGKLQRHFSLKGAFGFEYDPVQVEFTCETHPLYPDTAFGQYGKYGIVYERRTPLIFRLHVYEDGVGEVNELRKLADQRGNVFDHLYDFEEWTEVENLADYFVDENIISR